MTPQEFIARIEGILGSRLVDGEVRVQFPYDTLGEARQQMARIRTLQRELRLVKKEVGFTAKQVRSAFIGQRAEVGTGFGSGLVAGFFGRRTAGRMNAARREDLRRGQLEAVAPYEKISRFLENMLVQLDGFKVQLEQWMADRKFQIDAASERTPPPPLPAMPPPLPLLASRYFVYVQAAVAGPYTLEQIKALEDTGIVTAETPCCLEGTEDWIGYGTLRSGGVG